MIKQKEFIRNLKKNLSKIEDDTLYSTNEVYDLNIILSDHAKPSKQRVYRALKSLSRVNMGTESHPRWFVSGKTLREYAEARYISKFNK